MSIDHHKRVPAPVRQHQYEFWTGKAAKLHRRPAAVLPVLAAVALAAAVALSVSGCDHGLVPPDDPPVGSILATITYEADPQNWPPRDSLHDLRFVAMRFVPLDTTDFLNLHRIVFSEPLAYNVPNDVMLLESVAAGAFLYSGVAQKYGPGLFAWRPVGLYEEADGIFHVRSGETTHVSVHVDFRNPPPFPPNRDSAGDGTSR